MKSRESIDELTNELIELETMKRCFIKCDSEAENYFDDFLDNSGVYGTYKIFHLEIDPSKILKTMDILCYRDELNSWCSNQVLWADREITRLTEALDRHSKEIEGSLVRVISKKEYDDSLLNNSRSEYLISDSSYFMEGEETLYIEIEEYSFYVCCDVPKGFSYEEVEVFIEQIKEGISN